MVERNPCINIVNACRKSCTVAENAFSFFRIIRSVIIVLSFVIRACCARIDIILVTDVSVSIHYFSMIIEKSPANLIRFYNNVIRNIIGIRSEACRVNTEKS